MVSFSRSIIDRLEPQGVRGRALVRDRQMMTFPATSPTLPRPVVAANDRNGTQCCCGTQPCQDPCTASDCEYCAGQSVLTALDMTYAVERWAPVSGAPIFPTCNNILDACPGQPADCAALNPQQSYERANSGQSSTQIVVHDWHLSDPVAMTTCGTFSGSIGLRVRQSGIRSTPFNNPPCAVTEQPVDSSTNVSFSFIRMPGGWKLFSSGGGTDFNYHNGSPSPCNATNCTANRCDGQAVLDDLICALLPLNCEVGDIHADSGCVQTIADGGVLKCEKSRARLNLVWNIEK